MSRLIDLLNVYGADTAVTMERFLQDEALYQSCLQSFSADPAFDELRRALQKQDFTAAFNAAHTLKGVAGNLGLTPLFNTISTLVEALRAKEFSNVVQQHKAICLEKERMESILLCHN
ncbi:MULTISPECIES: Hpt domain-containing protein [Caproicibacterium]|uniref:Hpt domain-containing protein n=1 Tax=Caproicibacterium argilliputei TaxID=3030016 RepID=A0AA97D9M4_9FIRM|nr:Hpt domain-containing protein [Caproicibacterium argilliputei]WOC31371.1 Hpt domain-containing protein [Caproicibacterium argilliputei]